MKLIRIVAAVMAPVLLSGCFFIPGKFTSNMDVRRDGSFTFAYNGELVFQIPDEKMMKGDSEKEDKKWTDKMAVCWSDDSKEVDKYGIYAEDDDEKPAIVEPKKSKSAKKAKRLKLAAWAAEDGAAEDDKATRTPNTKSAAEEAGEAAAEAAGAAADAAANAVEDGDDAAAAVAEDIETPTIRPCTKAEIAELKSGWDEEKRKDAETAAQMKQAMAAIFGMDPSNPEGMNDFAKTLMKQAGWRKVEYKGEGVFMVDYLHTGRLDQDFVFPLLPDQQLLVPFVMIKRRADGAALVETPGYSLGTNGGMIGSMAALASEAIPGGTLDVGDQKKPMRNPMDHINGKFTITTDGEILTNNTADGPTAVASQPAARQLFWEFNDAKDPAPKALIKLR